MSKRTLMKMNAKMNERVVTQKEFDEAVKAHQEFLASKGKRGEVLFFDGCDLSGVKFKGVVLKGINYNAKYIMNKRFGFFNCEFGESFCFDDCVFEECTFFKCALFDIEVYDSKFLHCYFDDSYMVNGWFDDTEFSRSSFNHVAFSGSFFKSSEFLWTTFENVNLHDCCFSKCVIKVSSASEECIEFFKLINELDFAGISTYEKWECFD